MVNIYFIYNNHCLYINKLASIINVCLFLFLDVRLDPSNENQKGSPEKLTDLSSA